MDCRFQHPFTCMITGPTGSGKTVFIRRLLRHFRELTTIEAETLKVLYAYGQFQTGVSNDIPNVHIKAMEGLPNEKVVSDFEPHLIVVDDLMHEVADDKDMAAFFTRKSHHENISIIFIVQNYNQPGKEMRTIKLNTHYVVAMKNPRDRQQIMNLGFQAFGKGARWFSESYDDALQRPFGYLILDMHPRANDNLRVRTRIFPDENVKGVSRPIVYIAK